MSGVVDNFQLHMLLMDEFPSPGGILGRRRRRISRSAAAVARGEGPQQTDEDVVGAWNPYAYAAYSGGSLPDPEDVESRDLWIWNEGVPADIPVFRDRRVVLLGPPSYERHWTAQRTFDPLPATLDARALSRDEVQEWLAAIEAENERSRPS